MHRTGDRARGQAPDGVRRAVVGVLDGYQRAVARTRHKIRPLADASRSPALLWRRGGRPPKNDYYKKPPELSVAPPFRGQTLPAYCPPQLDVSHLPPMRRFYE